MVVSCNCSLKPINWWFRFWWFWSVLICFEKGFQQNSAWESLFFGSIWMIIIYGWWYGIIHEFQQWPFQESIDWRYLPYTRPIFKAYVREYPNKIWSYMVQVQYLHLRILKFLLISWGPLYRVNDLCYYMGLWWESTWIVYDCMRSFRDFMQPSQDKTQGKTCWEHDLRISTHTQLHYTRRFSNIYVNPGVHIGLAKNGRGLNMLWCLIWCLKFHSKMLWMHGRCCQHSHEVKYTLAQGTTWTWDRHHDPGLILLPSDTCGSCPTCNELGARVRGGASEDWTDESAKHISINMNND